MLGSRPTGTVTVTPASSSPELAVAPRQLSFTAANYHSPQEVTVSAAQDADAVADEPVLVEHMVRGGGYGGAAARPLTATILEDDVSTLAVAAAYAAEHAGRMTFEVSLSLASDGVVTVEFATGAAGDTAAEGQDYAGTSGTLRFPARSTDAQVIEVTVHDDALDEDDPEHFTVTLSNPANAELAGGGATVSATGEIEDDDPKPRLSIADASLTEGAGDAMPFVVRLDPPSGRTVAVHYATADATAVAGSDYTRVGGTLNFPAGTTRRTIAVPIGADDAVEETETFTVTLSSPQSATLFDASATGTIADNDEAAPPAPLQLASLRVTGGGTMYPAFSGDVLHYALHCDDPAALQVSAQALRSEARLTLLRDDPAASVVSSNGSLSTAVTVDHDHDIAIELGGDDGTVTYVVHCLPREFVDITILKKTDGVSDGLLFATPTYTTPNGRRITYMSIVDNNGVPRFHRTLDTHVRNFRRHGNSPLLDGKRVRYSVSIGGAGGTYLFDENFERIRRVQVVAPLTIDSTDSHDFLITEDDTYLLVAFVETTRDLCTGDESCPSLYVDSVIQEVTLQGSQVFLWNSWDHLKLDDCRKNYSNYAWLNSLHLIEGDIIASFRRCSLVARIDRSSGTWDVEWQVGGTLPTRDPATALLPIVGDPDEEFCGQHQASVTASGSLLLFDNGILCRGPRQFWPPFTRAVEYNVSSGSRASFVRAYPRPPGHGYTHNAGGVTFLADNNHWLISWAGSTGSTAPLAELIAVSEVDAGGTSVFEMHLSKSNRLASTYRVYREPEADVEIPLNLP